MTQFSIVPTHLSVKAMRDNGYKNAAYALAELMDNSIQAQATHVELLCAEKKIQVSERKRRRVHEVAVSDNGTGMNAQVLRESLQFGNGQYLNPDKHTGIGRFGMGLPCSSISQCRKVEVWTWQNGIQNSIYSYLSLDEIENSEMSEVPEPISKPVPSLWMQVMQNKSSVSGTLVVWSSLDRCLWRTNSAIIDNSEFLIGRIYRRFLNTEYAINHALKPVRIRLVSFDVDSPTSTQIDREALPNDPIYLMQNTSCPAPYDQDPMFEPYGEGERHHKIRFNDQDHVVTIRYAMAKDEPRSEDQAGAKPYGKHAAKNLGVSIMRADRELELEDTWVIQYDAKERWWGVEIDIPPSLDDIFGVTNNKQSARTFSDLAKFDLRSALSGGKTITQLKEEMTGDEDPRAPLIELAYDIDKCIKNMRKNVQNQNRGQRRTNQQRYAQPNAPEKIMTERTQSRKQETGKVGMSDHDEKLPLEQREEALVQALKISHVHEADSLAAYTISNGLKYIFADGDLDQPAFFSVRKEGGVLSVILNSNHPVYDKLVGILEEDIPENISKEKLTERLEKSLDGIKRLLSAWARYEDEQIDEISQDRIRQSRSDWGTIARHFLRD